jgi:hypothetical protein
LIERRWAQKRRFFETPDGTMHNVVRLRKPA